VAAILGLQVPAGGLQVPAGGLQVGLQAPAGRRSVGVDQTYFSSTDLHHPQNATRIDARAMPMSNRLSVAKPIIGDAAAAPLMDCAAQNPSCGPR
jgi:hypothetical protein